MPDDWVEKANFEFMKYIWRFNKHDRPKLVTEVIKNKSKDILIFHKSQDLKRYLDSVIIV